MTEIKYDSSSSLNNDYTTELVKIKNNISISGSFINPTAYSGTPPLDSAPHILNLHKRSHSGPPKALKLSHLLKRTGSANNVPQSNYNVQTDMLPEVSITLEDDPLDMDEPAYMRIMQHNNPIYKEHITAVVAQLFPDLEATQECVTILNNFLQDILVWCVMESGRHAEKDKANSILSCHMQYTLKKLLQTTKDPPTSAESSVCSTPNPTPPTTPSSTPNSSLSSIVELSNPSPVLTPASADPKAVPTLDYIINKRLFIETAQALPVAPAKLTSYFLLADHALARFSALVNDTSQWAPPTSQDDVSMMSKPVRGSTICSKAITVIDRSPKEVFAVVTDWEEQRKWNNVLYEFKFVEVLDKNTVICYQRYLSKACLVKSERDFCTLLHWFENKDGACVMLAQSVEHELCPPINGITRGKINSSGYAIVPLKDGGSRVTYCIDVDLVNVPSSVTSIIQRQLNLLPRLRRYLSKLPPSPASSPSPSPSHSPSESRSNSPMLSPMLTSSHSPNSSRSPSSRAMPPSAQLSPRT